MAFVCLSFFFCLFVFLLWKFTCLCIHKNVLHLHFFLFLYSPLVTSFFFFFVLQQQEQRTSSSNSSLSFPFFHFPIIFLFGCSIFFILRLAILVPTHLKMWFTSYANRAPLCLLFRSINAEWHVLDVGIVRDREKVYSVQYMCATSKHKVKL